MAVVEQVALTASIISNQDIQKLQNLVMEAQDVSEQLKIGTQEIRRSTDQRRGGIFGAGEIKTALPKNITRRQTKAENDRLTDSMLQNAFKNKDKTSATPFVRTNAFKEVQKDVSLLKEGQQKTTEALSFVTDFQGTAFTKLMGAANKVLPVGFALSIATTVYGLIVAQFGSGGIFDIRKQELNSVKSLIGLERETDIIGGDTLFLGNPTLVQGVAKNQTSNTENLRDGQRRFVLRSNGY